MITKQIDACGLQCPGPILQLRTAIDEVDVGQSIRVTATDPGFAADVQAWCRTTGHQLAEVKADAGQYHATITKQAPSAAARPNATVPNKRAMTAVVFSGDFDKAVASFIIANGAAAMGYDVTLFFTFWGLNVLRKGNPPAVRKTLVERMFGWMMPRGAEKLALSKMHMAGMGLSMIKGIMRKKNVASLPKLIDSAKANGVRLVACAMSMDLMGIKGEELIDGVEQGGVAMYLDHAGQGNVNLFI